MSGLKALSRGLRATAATVAAVAVLALTAVLAPASPAHAVTSLTCVAGAETTKYQPGLLLAPRQTHVSAEGIVGTCLGLPLTHTGGTITFTGDGPLSCTIGNASGSGTIDWVNTGAGTSTFDWTGAVGVRPAGDSALVLTGTIKSGDFKNAKIIITIELVAHPYQSLQCLSTGLETNSGLVTTQILG
ncbi:hypothetical protein [Streptomyces lavendulocolor]|uniref:hypothetical protein n=1 Tax=Streptomyces lavendulocolor TaxID=67316 RepID=UPI003C2D396E